VRRASPKKTSVSGAGAFLTLAFVGESRGRKLNKQFRRKDYATDVLSFVSDRPGQGLGELVFCVPVLKKQALEQTHSFQAELNTMLVHGFLHLLGYDHERSKKDHQEMMGLQEKLLKKYFER
jgi:probable rRNA maturation factor